MSDRHERLQFLYDYGPYLFEWEGFTNRTFSQIIKFFHILVFNSSTTQFMQEMAVILFTPIFKLKKELERSGVLTKGKMYYAKLPVPLTPIVMDDTYNWNARPTMHIIELNSLKFNET